MPSIDPSSSSSSRIHSVCFEIAMLFDVSLIIDSIIIAHKNYVLGWSVSKRHGGTKEMTLIYAGHFISANVSCGCRRPFLLWPPTKYRNTMFFDTYRHYGILNISPERCLMVMECNLLVDPVFCRIDDELFVVKWPRMMSQFTTINQSQIVIAMTHRASFAHSH